ncbi:AraC family transcriptional regulator [Clostridium guangxiense]|uniref:AraC family transcriptional regulator n=1 Tax=Clostridium guangxiense TaxID=1662055 RepID=UPI001E6337E5|nr:AraC family transcriptional regulator [Clostridium guangxiense]MCD2345629.1 AraC family transcriptional regulator [Clostridium guangxiense]
MFVEYTTSKYVNTDLNVTCYGHQACYSKHYWGPGIRDYYLIHYVIRGKGILKTAEKVYEVNAGETFIIEPKTLSYYEADKDDPWEYFWIGFNGIRAKHYVSQIYEENTCPIFDCKKSNGLEQCLSEMLSYSYEQDGRDIILQSYLYKFIYLLIKSIGIDKRNTQNNIAEKYVNDAAAYICNNYSNDIKVCDIAKYVNITRAYLFRLFKKYLHTSPQQFLINLRMEKASELLKNPCFTIGHVARSVGYRDVLLFSKIFKKNIGISPSEFRKQI